MRETFRGYYRPTDKEFSELWENCIFCFDANILLNIYRYSPETRKKFMNILNEISDRIIIPYQAAKEYQDNRLNVIKDQEDAYDKIMDNIKRNFKKTKENLNSYKKHPLINVDKIVADLDNLCSYIEESLQNNKSNHPNLFYEDDLREELTSLLDGKISKPCPLEKKDRIQEECEYRYKNLIPPGYKDGKKDENKCGDLILWFQLIKIAKTKNSPLIFITDDKKEDWWWIVEGKTIGPRQELIEEIHQKVDVQYYMYKTDQFIEFAEKEFFKKDADPEFIDEVKDVMDKWDKNYNFLRNTDEFNNELSNFEKNNLTHFYFEIQKNLKKLDENKLLLELRIDKLENILSEFNVELILSGKMELCKSAIDAAYENYEDIYNNLIEYKIDLMNIRNDYPNNTFLNKTIENLNNELNETKTNLFLIKSKINDLKNRIFSIRSNLRSN